MTTTNEIIQRVLGNDFNPKKIPDTTEPKKINSKSLDAKRAELEVLQIQKQIDNLSKPDVPETNYFKQMLDQQQAHFNQLLEMNKQQNDIKIELERMKIMQEYETPDEGSGIIEMLTPFLPQILNNLKNGAGSTSLTNTLPPLTTQQEIKPEVKGGEQPNMFSDKTNIKELEEYKAKIRSGEITEQQAYKDFEEAVPPMIFKLTPYSKFKEEFEKIKNPKNI